MFAAKLYDGHSAFPHDVSAAFADGRLTLTQDNGWEDRIDAALLKRLDGGPEPIRLGRSDALPGPGPLPGHVRRQFHRQRHCPPDRGAFVHRLRSSAD